MNGIKTLNIVTVLVVAALASTVSAHSRYQGSPSRDARLSWSSGNGHSVGMLRASRPYQRGYAAGRNAGWREGFEDARNRCGRAARGHVRGKHHLPRRYLAGYRKGFVDGYELGYRRGARQQRRWRWYW